MPTPAHTALFTERLFLAAFLDSQTLPLESIWALFFTQMRSFPFLKIAAM